MSVPDWPRGFAAHVATMGIRSQRPDLSVVWSDLPCRSAGVFTRSLFAGASVKLNRERLAPRDGRGVVVVAGIANVATGTQGDANARETADTVAERLGIPVAQMLIESTGVIGWQYPMETMRPYLRAVDPQGGADVEEVARAMMTTDTVPKWSARTVGDAKIVGVAKGVGMIEPDMATLLVNVFTDADIDADEIDRSHRAAVDVSFNALSIDTDTSTSDSAIILANGAAGPVDGVEWERQLADLYLDLTRQLARDGEGATKLLAVTVDHARNDAQAKRVAKAVVNSPLVKTAVHGTDPNWGRVAMAIGKCSDDLDIDPDRLVIRFDDLELYPAPAGPEQLAALRDRLTRDEVHIGVSLGTGQAAATVYGCDLSRDYIAINADYTT